MQKLLQVFLHIYDSVSISEWPPGDRKQGSPKVATTVLIQNLTVFKIALKIILFESLCSRPFKNRQFWSHWFTSKQ